MSDTALAPAVMRAGTRGSVEVEPMTCSIGALLTNVDLGDASRDERLALKAQFPDAEHPVVRTHPETGEKVPFVNAFTTHFTNYHTPQNVRFGQDANPGASHLLNYLITQAYVPEFQVRFRFRRNSVAIWDNRCTQHYAVQDFWPAVRNLERAGIVGDRPC